MCFVDTFFANIREDGGVGGGGSRVGRSTAQFLGGGGSKVNGENRGRLNTPVPHRPLSNYFTTLPFLVIVFCDFFVTFLADPGAVGLDRVQPPGPRGHHHSRVQRGGGSALPPV